jgi:DNA-binding response OmpR family regulator
VQKVILVIEQNTILRDTITHLLRRVGYLVLAADDGVTAMDVTRLHPISLIILDPDSLQPGWSDLCHQLRRCDETAHVPILMMATSEDEMTHMMRHGPRVDDFMLKSFVWEELRGRVRASLRGSKRIQKVILVVEQDAGLRDTITDSLRREGYFVLAVTDDDEAINIARNSPISLIILDPTSPQQRIDTSRLLRASDETIRLPILMMATSQMEIAQLVRVSPGVNDFIMKPFMWEELRACVRALLRGDTLRIDLGQRRVIRGDQQIHLGSPLLFHLLVYLVRHRSDVLTRGQLLQQVWCREGVQNTRTVDAHVHWLRQKLHDDPHDPQLIQTVPGMGYRFTG